MPSYADSFEEEERWALAYYVLSLSAFTDPLNREPLKISDEARQALNDPELKAARSQEAYGLMKQAADNGLLGGNAWAKRRGMEVIDSAKADGASKNGNTK